MKTKESTSIEHIKSMEELADRLAAINAPDYHILRKSSFHLFHSYGG